MPRTADHYTALALDAFNAGFASKSAQKTAIENVTRAYDLNAQAIRDALLADRTIGGNRDGWAELYYNVPALHNWKAKHDATYAFAGDLIQSINDLVELRATIKNAAVAPVPVREVSKYEVAAIKTIQDIITLRKTQYARAIDLGTIFNGLPVQAHTHQVTNQYGTTFLRTFYYLFGDLTPLNIIIAAAEELARREKAA
jgi:hypothetical protein